MGSLLATTLFKKEENMKKLSLLIICYYLALGGGIGLKAAVYSTVDDNGITAINLNTGATISISADRLGLQEGDDIDALSLGDDTKIFGKKRHDIFVVNLGATGIGGALKDRSSYGLNVSQDLYISSITEQNKLYYRSLISSGSIDAFDFGIMVDANNNEVLNKWIYFSLTPNSPTLLDLNATAGDIFAVIPNQPSTLKIFLSASAIGTPTDINALSMHITDPVIGYNPSSDYIIYSTAGSSDVYHYGFGAPVGNQPHSALEFGLDTNDDIEALEHNVICLYDNCLHIKLGWQLFGLSDGISDIKNIFQNQADLVNAIWAYDTDKSSWKFYSPNPNLMSIANSNLFETVDFIKENEGFWIQGKRDGDICIPVGEEE